MRNHKTKSRLAATIPLRAASMTCTFTKAQPTHLILVNTSTSIAVKRPRASSGCTWGSSPKTSRIAGMDDGDDMAQQPVTGAAAPDQHTALKLARTQAKSDML